MFSDLAELRNDLHEQIAPVLPSGWKVKPTLTAAIESLSPVLYFEFTEIQTSDPSGDLPRGQVSALLDLIVTDPQTGDGAEDAVDSHVVPLLRALDASDDIFWDNAKKERIASGPLAWRVSLRALVSIT